jgi:hypothetical protein
LNNFLVSKNPINTYKAILRISSVKKMTTLNFPIRKQETDYTCGHACMRGYIKFRKGIWVPEKDLVDIGQEAEKHMRSQEHEGLKTANEGLDFTGMRAIARTFELAGAVGYDLKKKDLSYFLKKDTPILINWVSDGEEVIRRDGKLIIGGHYSVVIDLCRNVVKLADPEIEMKTYYDIDYNELEEKWTKGYFSNKGVCLERRSNWGTVFWNREYPVRIPDWMRIGRF